MPAFRSRFQFHDHVPCKFDRGPGFRCFCTTVIDGVLTTRSISLSLNFRIRSLPFKAAWVVKSHPCGLLARSPSHRTSATIERWLRCVYGVKPYLSAPRKDSGRPCGGMAFPVPQTSLQTRARIGSGPESAPGVGGEERPGRHSADARNHRRCGQRNKEPPRPCPPNAGLDARTGAAASVSTGRSADFAGGPGGRARGAASAGFRARLFREISRCANSGR